MLILDSTISACETNSLALVFHFTSGNYAPFKISDVKAIFVRRTMLSFKNRSSEFTANLIDDALKKQFQVMRLSAY